MQFEVGSKPLHKVLDLDDPVHSFTNKLRQNRLCEVVSQQKTSVQATVEQCKFPFTKFLRGNLRPLTSQLLSLRRALDLQSALSNFSAFVVWTLMSTGLYSCCRLSGYHQT